MFMVSFHVDDGISCPYLRGTHGGEAGKEISQREMLLVCLGEKARPWDRETHFPEIPGLSGAVPDQIAGRRPRSSATCRVEIGCRHGLGTRRARPWMSRAAGSIYGPAAR